MEKDTDRGARRVTIVPLRAGQQRPYADSINEYRMTFEWIPYHGPATWISDNTREAEVRRQAFAVDPWDESIDPEKWAHPKLVEIIKELPHVWRFTVRRAYTD